MLLKSPDSPKGIGSMRLMVECPHCGGTSVFLQIGQDLGMADQYYTGQRKCPNPRCSGHVFIVGHGDKLLKTYPPARVHFDSSNIPDKIVSTLSEALDCHSSGNYVASAIMIRRTLEEVCEDRGASGKVLKEKIKDLRTKIVLPQELLDAFDELRLLGNDAAHVEAKSYDNISKPELDVAIEFTKEILKGLYQYSDLLARLRALKKEES